MRPRQFLSGLVVGTTPISGGATTQVLFNLGGVISSDADMTFVTDTLTVAKLTVSTGPLTVVDAMIERDAANVLAFRNGTTAQHYHVYRTYTDASNYERLYIGEHPTAVGATGFAIWAQAAGTGTGRPLVIGNDVVGQSLDFRAGGANRWELQSDGVLVPLAGNSYDIGSAANQPRSLYIGTSILPGTSGNFKFSHGTAALATDATGPFFHLQSCAGAPTGVPASIPTGQIPMVFDTTNSRLYIYHGAAWHYIAQTA